jgi:hypothetical protein
VHARAALEKQPLLQVARPRVMAYKRIPLQPRSVICKTKRNAARVTRRRSTSAASLCTTTSSTGRAAGRPATRSRTRACPRTRTSTRWVGGWVQCSTVQCKDG